MACGERVGPRDAQLAALLGRVGGPDPAQAVPAAAAVAAAPAAQPSGLRLPPRGASALLVLVFLGFGVFLGDTAGSRVENTLAASARPAVKLILAPTASTPAGSESTTATPPPSTTPPASLASEAPENAAPPASTTPSRKSAAGSGKASTPASSTGTGSSGAEGSPGSSAGGSSGKLPRVKHVFMIVLSEQPYASVFGPASTAPYLSQTLERRGELLTGYDAVAHEGLANEVALLSGQGPTVATAANCPIYTDIFPGAVGADQQVSGVGCVYPHATQTLAGQLAAKHLTWRAYVQGIDEPPGRTAACGHPVLGQADPTAAAPLPAGQTSATFRNPFVYFHSVTDSPTCAADDVGLRRLSADLANSKHTPSLSYIAPDRCHDGSPTPCVAGAPAGLLPADGFLKKVVPEILSSKAYKEGGLLVITVDQAPSSGLLADSSSCCGEPRFANLPAPAGATAPVLVPKGGGAVGALLLSSFVKPGTTSHEPFNHFSLLRTIEDLFALKHLGYAGSPGVSSFGASVFSAQRSR
jgi:hypothetical protein